MKYSDWLEEVPNSIKCDALWNTQTYRKALFLSELAWHDCEQLLKHPLGKPIAHQLIRSSGSVPANIEEGFGRGFGRDYGRFLRIAIGSARETRGWYFRGRKLIAPEVLNHRLQELDAIIAGLVIISRQQSQKKKPTA